ncbi:Alpha/Beta hydrolase protein [Pelagophyceae sp. CCMP2097]|nr:Alpha/Beta hydrolase protein [Pelagophyceae sp. CCMP2097]
MVPLGIVALGVALVGSLRALMPVPDHRLEVRRTTAALMRCYEATTVVDGKLDDALEAPLKVPPALFGAAFRAATRRPRKRSAAAAVPFSLEAVPNCVSIVACGPPRRARAERTAVAFVRQLLEDHDAFETSPRPQKIRKLRYILDVLGRAQSLFSPVFLGVRVRRLQDEGVPGLSRYTWFEPRDAIANTSLVYLHGGGFVIGSRYTNGEMVARIAEATRCRVLLVEYRRVPEAKFPDALVDALRGVDLALALPGAAPGRLLLGGDSAGGALALAALLVLRSGANVVPAAAILLSPLVDLEKRREKYSSELSEVDLLPTDLSNSLSTLLELYAPSGATLNTRWLRRAHRALVSPAAATLRQLRSLKETPVLVHAGEAEVLRDSIVAWARRASRAGASISLRVFAGEVHAFHAFAFAPGWPAARLDLRDFVGDALRRRAALDARPSYRQTARSAARRKAAALRDRVTHRAPRAAAAAA